MAIDIEEGTLSNFSDEVLTGLLHTVYVEGGFVRAEIAKIAFEPHKVRARGTLWIAKERQDNTVVGMVVFVPFDSPVSVRAKAGDCEIHLLAVHPDYRGQGIAKRLMQAVFSQAQQLQCQRIILWTQHSMKAAQSLYQQLGFISTGEMEKSGIKFIIFERELK